VNRVAANPWPWLAAAATLLLAGWLWHWLTTNFERRTEQVEVGLTAAARRNPFLAAERFLRRAGVEAESRAGRGRLRVLPEPRDTLIVRGLGPLGADRRAAIMDWIDAGGRLVVEAMVPVAEDAVLPRDNLLTDVGVVLREDDTGDDDAAREVMATLEPAPGARDPIEVGFIERYYLEDLSGDASGGIDADGRPRLLRYDIGDGSLVALSDTLFMSNGDIGHHDHALFTFLLAGAGTGRVWLLYDSAAPGLPALLWQLAPQALTAAAVLLALLLWHPGGRLGPLLPAPPRARRDLLLHLDAAAELLWRHGRGGLQLAATRARVERAWLRRHPALRALSPRRRADWLAAHTGLDADAIARALYRRTTGALGDAELIQATRTLRQLWRQEHPRRPAADSR
jgi:hypothetical protein